MNQFNPAITAYMDKSAEFALPILHELRMTVHNYCPEVVEAMKWSFPNFMYKGSILCSMAAFKHHCSFGFWLENMLEDPEGILKGNQEGGMGSLGKIRSADDLPSADKLGTLILQAMSLIDAGVKQKKTAVKEPETLIIPEALADALANDEERETAFNKFSYSHKKEYIDWLNGAKTETTLQKRLTTMMNNLGEGKSKEWKYQR